MNAYLEINSAQAKINENAKIAAAIVSYFPLTFFSDSMTYILNGYEKSSIKTITFLTTLENALIFLIKLTIQSHS